MDWLLIALGLLITGGGLVLFVSPLPMGFALILPGLALLVIASDRVARFVRRRREHHPEFDERLKDAEQIMPDEVSDPVEERTDPKQT
ncbi:hypothetical protein PB2503_06237 [Parvularcula bermudensis HTCC2503]|uniref:Uncharacterized protein n=1 Tax=Parvularcula bermudensis (strain ATCC BAA-594 / HTCC2503 / KCTC 12087) TaxID=314260 RepID=E0THL7_PARBH|nr:hypothetical protein [Parvularcula bermudensis]ADM09313.1 hypothetical protein PB2503_06237 [Parvularcula bermudensis HTCC2503]